MVTDEDPRRLRDRSSVVVRPEHPGRDPGAVHEQKELSGQAVGIAKAGLAGQPGEPIDDRALVVERDTMARVVQLRELGRCALEGAAEAARAGRELPDRVEGREKLGPRLVDGRSCLLEPGHELGVGALEVRGDQLVLRREVAVEGHLRHA
jgi:hypothetical protein